MPGIEVMQYRSHARQDAFRKAPFASHRCFWYTPNATEGRRRMAQRRTVAWLVGVLVLGTVTFHTLAWATDMCGDLNEPCCFGSGPPIVCNTGRSCARSGKCISGSCGGLGQPCCRTFAFTDVFGAPSTTDPAAGEACGTGIVCQTAIGPNGICDPQSPAPALSPIVLSALLVALLASGGYQIAHRRRGHVG